MPNLRKLVLGFENFARDSMASLSRLTALAELSLAQMPKLPPPASLAALTALRTLHLDLRAAVDAAELDAALPPLQQLTCLAVAGIRGVPAACGRLPQLQRLFLFSFEELEGEPALPPGLTSVRCLGASWEVVARSVPVLAAMPHLRELYVCTEPDCHVPFVGASGAAWRAFWRWAHQHAPLQRLGLQIEWRMSAEVAGEVQQLQRSRPALVIEAEDGCFWEPFHAE